MNITKEDCIKIAKKLGSRFEFVGFENEKAIFYESIPCIECRYYDTFFKVIGYNVFLFTETDILSENYIFMVGYGVSR